MITEYGMNCTLYRHKKSGAELLSIRSSDDDKLFGITFRTLPSDSTGIPHILEHVVLDGSRKFKAKNAFFKFRQGSLFTNMNARTDLDFTTYYGSSRNVKDFNNIVNFFTDSVFYPRVMQNPLIFSQEAWRLELESMDDPLIYNGIVYSEMKGVYSNLLYVLSKEGLQSIYPNHTYSYNSGGDPAVIPDATFEQLVDFHSKFYHPSNALIYFAGDDDVSTRLEVMDSYLQDFEDSPELKQGSIVKMQTKILSPVRRKIYYSANQEGIHNVFIVWLINHKPLTTEEKWTFDILYQLLLGTASSILFKTLSESGLGTGVLGSTDESVQISLFVGLMGVQKNDVPKVEQLVLDTLEKVVREGFSRNAMLSALTSKQFSLIELSSFDVMMTALKAWVHDESPLKNLKFLKPLADLSQKISVSGSKVFQDMVDTFLLKNMHRATIEMVSSTTMEAELVKDEEMRLAAIKASLSDKELRQVIAKTVEFNEYQEAEDSPEVRATIPTLELSDLVVETSDYPIAVTKNEANSGVEVTRHEFGSTGGLAYVSLGFDISMLSLEEASLLPLVTNIMMSAGAGEYNSVELSERIGIYTGGLDISILYTSVKDSNLEENVVTDGDFMTTKWVFSGKALSDNIDVLFSLFLLILNDSILDVKETVLEIIEVMITNTEANFGYSATYYTKTRIESRYTAERYIVEKLDGISQLVILKSSLELGKKDWPSLLSKLEKIRHSIVNNPAVRDGLFLDITGDSAVMKTIQPAVERLLESLPDSKNRENALDIYSQIHPWILAAKLEMSEKKVLIDEGIIIPTQVSYVGKGGLIYNIGEKVTGSDLVVLKFLSSEYLQDEIVFMGGAYDVGSTHSQPRFILVFSSYRDPNISKTLDVYDAAYDALMSAADEFEENPLELVPFQIGTLGLTDAAILSSAAKGWSAFTDKLKRISKNERQTVRDEIVKTKASDFRDFANRVRKMKDPSIAIVLSNESVDVATEEGLILKYTELF